MFSNVSGIAQTLAAQVCFLSFLPEMRQLLALLLLYVVGVTSTAAEYHEQLNLRPLPLSSLLASFNFRATTPVSDFEAQNFRLFPRSLGQILQYAGTRELHLRFALGRWDAELWGARPWDGTREGGTGVELWAWLDAETDEEYVADAFFPLLLPLRLRAPS